MDVHINEIVSRVRAVDGSAIGEKTLRRIVEAVLEALRQEREHATRVAAELEIGPRKDRP
jgi:hypothetical protein